MPSVTSDARPQTAVEFRDAGRRRTVSRFQAHGLRDDPAEPIEAHYLVELFPVRSRPRGQQHRVLKRDAAKIDGETARVSLCRRPRRHWFAAFERRWYAFR